MAQIEGEIPEELRALILDLIGEVETPSRSIAQARRRALQSAQKADDALRSQGYYSAQITTDIIERSVQSDDAVTVALEPVVKIETGTQFQFSERSIKLIPDTQELESLLSSQLTLKDGEPALAAHVVAQELALVNYLNANGYPDAFAKDRRVIVDHDTNKMRITYTLSTGQKTRFGQIKQTGSAYLSPGWPHMVAPFDPEEIFDSRDLNGLANNVIATGVFDGATATLAETGRDNADGTVTRDVILDVEQGAINTISGELGYSTTDGSGVTATYERRNYIGYAQTLTLTTTVKTNQIGAGIDYNIPYARRVDRSIDLGAFISREDTDAFVGERAIANARLTQELSERTKISLGIGLEASQFEQDGQEIEAYVVEGLGRGVYDSRNSLLDPETGVLIEGNIVPSYNFGSEDGVFTTVTLSGSTYRRVSDTLVAAVRAKAGTVFSEDFDTIPINRRFYGGGGGSVRGFGFQSISPRNISDELIGGRSVLEGSAEMRYRGDSAFGFAAFVDAASVSRSFVSDFDDVRVGAGVGLRYFTSFAPLRVDVAVPVNKRADDDALQVYISIGQAF